MATFSQEILFKLAIPEHKSPVSPSSGGWISVARIVPRVASSAEPTAAQSISSDPRSSKAKPGHGDQPPPPPIYLLTAYSPPDNRLTPPFLQTYTYALLKLQHGGYPYGMLITTSAIPKFFSNGLDLATFQLSDTTRYLYPFWRKLLTFPFPTCAVINGHGFAGGLMTAMYHDYRIMNPHRGWLSLNELEFDAELSTAMSAIFKSKVPNSTLRGLLLEAKRFNGLQALEAGLIDGLGGVEEAIKMMTDVEGGHGRGALVVSTRGEKTAYRGLREDIYREVLAKLDVTERESNAEREKILARRAVRDEEELSFWKKMEGSAKPKL